MLFENYEINPDITQNPNASRNDWRSDYIGLVPVP
jgi:hypothetical protein